MPPSRMGMGSRLKMPRLTRDVGHQADDGHPAGHLDGLVDLGADADGAAESDVPRPGG